MPAPRRRTRPGGPRLGHRATRPRSSRTPPTRRAPARALAPIAVAWLLLACAPQSHGQVGKLPEGKISEIRFEGNATIPPEKIKAKLLSKVGDPFKSRR